MRWTRAGREVRLGLRDGTGRPRPPYPTFGLALAALPDPRWSALAPSPPLRRWRLIELAQHARERPLERRLGTGNSPTESEARPEAVNRLG